MIFSFELEAHSVLIDIAVSPLCILQEFGEVLYLKVFSDPSQVAGEHGSNPCPSLGYSAPSTEKALEVQLAIQQLLSCRLVSL